MMIKRILTFALFAITISSTAQVVPISAARVQANGSTATIKGIVLNGPELGNIRYVYDGTAGIGLFGSNMATVQRGDSILATGTIAPYNNLAEITPVTSFTIINSNNPLPDAQLVTVPTGYAESYEAELVVIDNLTFSATGTFSGNTNYTVTDGSNTAQVRINTASPIVGTQIPVGPVTIRGIMSQFCSSPAVGCTTGYQLLPRDLADFIVAGNPPVFTTPLLQSNITTTSFDVSFQTQNAGNTIIRYGQSPTNLNLVISDNAQMTNHLVPMTGLQPATIYYVQGLSISSTNDTSMSAVHVMATASLSSGDIKVYFNRPVNHGVSSGVNAVYLNQELDDTLKAYIGRAQQTLDIMIYNVDNNNGVITAINQAAANGVTVRLVYDNAVTATNVGLLSNQVQKIVAPTGSAYGLMHNKILIIDANHADPNKPIYWTGSANFTDDQLNSDAQNVIIFQDQTLAKAATLEFNEMFGSSGPTPNTSLAKFGPDKTDNTPHEFVVGGKRVQVYFSPSDGVNNQVKNHLQAANSSIHFALFAFTRTEIANAIVTAVNNGAVARGIVESPADTTVYNILIPAMTTANLKVDNQSYQVHHKYSIVDETNLSSDPLVITGSYNYSTAATVRNDENIVIVHDATIANIYYQEWAKRFQDAGGVVITAIGEAVAKTSILLYPNPTTGTIYISVPSDMQNIQFSLFDVTGKLVKQWNDTNSANALDASDLSNGMYLLNVKGESFNSTVRFNKQ